MSKEKKKKKKPFYKRVWFWVIVVIFIIAIWPTENEETDDLSVDNNTSVAATSAPSAAASEETLASEAEDPLADVDITFSKSFNYDVTGKWRKALVLTSSPIQDYAVAYYNAYFQSDDEIHVVYNFSLNTVNCLKVFGDELFISITDYVDGEEHDANVACSGTFLGEYHINIDTGEITFNSFDD